MPASSGVMSELSVRALRAEDHALGLKACHLSRRQVHDDHDLLADHGLRGVLRAKTRTDLDDLVRSDLDLGAEKLSGLLDFLTLEDLADSELAFCEIVVGAELLMFDWSCLPGRSLLFCLFLLLFFLLLRRLFLLNAGQSRDTGFLGSLDLRRKRRSGRRSSPLSPACRTEGASCRSGWNPSGCRGP